MAKPIRQLVPPDGGWGWMVVFGVAVCNCTTQSLLSVYGLLFADTFEDMGVHTKGAAMISNVMVAITNFSGLGIGQVMRRFSYRQVAMVGGVLVALGMFLTGLATRMWHLLITYSILVGLGLGFLMPSTFVAVNAFFSSARGRAVGISLAGTGIGQMLMPHAVRFLLDEYSFRGCVLVLSAVALHALPGAMLFHPLHWHAKPAPPPARELELLTKPGRGDKAHIVRNSDQVAEECEPLTGAKEEKVFIEKCKAPTLSDSPTSAQKLTPSPSPLRDVAVVGENLPAVVEVKKEECVADGFKETLSVQVRVPETPAKSSGGCMGRWMRLLDFDMLADLPMLSLLMGLAAVYTAGVNFNMLFPFFLKEHVGLPRSDVALCMSFMAGFDISSRLLLPLFTDRMKVPARISFLMGSLLLALSRSLLALQSTLPGLLATSAVCGFVRGGTIVNLNLAISESCSPERLPGALGINMVLKGISILALGMFIGWLRDASNSYTLCIHLLSLVIVAPMSIWLVEIWQQRRRRLLRRSQHSLQEPNGPTAALSSLSPPPYESPPTLSSAIAKTSLSSLEDKR